MLRASSLLVLLCALAAPAAAQGQGQGNQGQGSQGPPPQIFADCSSCDESLTPPVYYGCIGDDAYVEYDGVRIDCGAALSLDQTASIPKFYFPNATEDSLYALVVVDTLEIDPIVGTVARDTPAAMALALLVPDIAMTSNTEIIPVTVPISPRSGHSATSV